MKKKTHVEPTNFVEIMEEIIEILQASENGEIGCKVKVLNWPQGS
jgi:hypothetical protein